jgi:hypothetical protein
MSLCLISSPYVLILWVVKFAAPDYPDVSVAFVICHALSLPVNCPCLLSGLLAPVPEYFKYFFAVVVFSRVLARLDCCLVYPALQAWVVAEKYEHVFLSACSGSRGSPLSSFLLLRSASSRTI